jgi:hypothetical protein
MIVIDYQPRKSFSKAGRSLDHLECPVMPSPRAPALVVVLRPKPRPPPPSTRDRPCSFVLKFKKEFNKNLDYRVKEGLVFPRTAAFSFPRSRPASAPDWHRTLRSWSRH